MLDTVESTKAQVQFNGNTKNIEMSRYIDLDLYHAIERSHAFYEEMLVAIKTQVKKFAQENQGRLKVLEIGAGTGLLTQELLEINELDIDALDLDEECIRLHKQHVQSPRCQAICDDAVTYNKSEHYDLLTSAFAHDHIPYDKKKQFSLNIKNNLRPGGIYIMGGEILPVYTDDASRKEALYTYHSYIIDRALKEGHYELAQLEINALKSGVHKIGDFKRHEKEFEEEMNSSGLILLSKEKMGPSEFDDIGGVYVYVYQKPSL